MSNIGCIHYGSGILCVQIIPYNRNPIFTGREDSVNQIHHAGYESQALIGPNGNGKTQIAVEYAYRHRNTYKFVFWVNASAGISPALRNRLLPELRELGEARWLLVLDQIEEKEHIDQMVPNTHPGGHVLLTTSAATIPKRISVIPVPPFSDTDGALFLLRRSGVLGPGEAMEQASLTVQCDAIAIARQLQGFPLALDQAGGYIKMMQICLPDYFHLLTGR